VGFTILALEFAGVRLLAPAFGQSSLVWSAVLALTLLGLAAGYQVGGQRAARTTSDRGLGVAMIVAGLWALGAALGGPLLRDFVLGLLPSGTEQGVLRTVSFVGSLLVTAVLIVPPVFLLAMTSPWLITRLGTREDAGRASGSIIAAGTIGSLVACYYTPQTLLPLVGTRRTLLLCGALAVAAGAVLLLRERRRAAARTAAPPVEDGNEQVGAFPRRVLLAALLAGMAVTVIEFGGMRFLSPWVGQSNPIWGTVIAMVMLTLALGAYVGGRSADAATGKDIPMRGLLLASAWLLVGAYVLGAPLLEYLVPRSLTSLHVLPVARSGALVATIVLFAPPLLVLGAVSPWLVRIAGEHTSVARAGAGVLAWGTVGGVVGCVITPSLLVPHLGSRAALAVAAALGCVALQLVGRREGALQRMPVVGVLLALLLAVFVRPPLRVHDGQLTEIESTYQTIRVVEAQMPWLLPTPQPAVGGPRGRSTMRYLRHDEDAETYQSAWLRIPESRIVETWDDALGWVSRELPKLPEGATLTGGQYFEQMALGAHMAKGRPGAPLRVLLIGYAGGSVNRVLEATAPAGVAIDLLGVEIDPAVVDVADTHLGHAAVRARYDQQRRGPGTRLRIITGEDARTVVNLLRPGDDFDLILVDAYARTNYLPFQLASVEFFEKLDEHLAPGGWVGVNVLGTGMRSPVAGSVAYTMDHALGAVWRVPNPTYAGNVILWASKEATAPRLRTSGFTPWLMRRAAYCLERLATRYQEEPGQASRVELLTDDRSISDVLADEELGLK
jgi:spermidine synthase